MQALLSTRTLSVRIGTKSILTDIDLDVIQGEFLALVGANGSGKTTLLHCLAHLRKPTQGGVFWKGVPLGDLPRRQMAKHIALLPQHPQAPTDLSVQALVRMGRTPHRTSLLGSDIAGKEAVAQAMQSTGITELSTRSLGTLSGGERQRAWIAMALAQDPDVFLLDEPTTFLDIAHQLAILDMLKKWNRQSGKTIVAILHDLNQALRYADRVAVLDQGALHSIMAAEHSLNAETLRAAFHIGADSLHDKRHDCRLLVPHLDTLSGEV